MDQSDLANLVTINSPNLLVLFTMREHIHKEDSVVFQSDIQMRKLSSTTETILSVEALQCCILVRAELIKLFSVDRTTNSGTIGG